MGKHTEWKAHPKTANLIRIGAIATMATHD